MHFLAGIPLFKNGMMHLNVKRQFRKVYLTRRKMGGSTPGVSIKPECSCFHSNFCCAAFATIVQMVVKSFTARTPHDNMNLFLCVFKYDMYKCYTWSQALICQKCINAIVSFSSSDAVRLPVTVTLANTSYLHTLQETQQNAQFCLVSTFLRL